MTDRPPLRVAFLDRDGTLNAHKPGYRTVDDFEMLPGAAEAVRLLNDAGVYCVLVTNQQGVGKGVISQTDLDAVHHLLADELAAVGAHLDRIIVCPHVAGTCECRKPKPGMIEGFFEAHPEYDRAGAVFFGDASSDEEAALAARVRFSRVSAGTPLLDAVRLTI